MFSKKIINTDAFLDMPLTTQLLYFHLAMNADDEGFVGGPKRIMRVIGCGSDDLKILIAKRYLLRFESGVVVIKHWLIHNTLKVDRTVETTYKKEKNTLKLNEFKAYTENGSKMVPQIRLDKKRLDKISIAFETFWNLYDKKVGDKKKLEKKWNNLKDIERKQIIEYLPKYIKSTPDKKFRKNPQTFLNNKSWEDEIIEDTNNNEEILLHDGTKAIKYKGKWVDAKNKLVKLDLHYYPELNKL